MDHSYWKVRWFRAQKIHLPDGTTHMANVGGICWCCGVSIECWPMKTKTTCIHEFQTDSSFKADLLAVRVGAQKASEKLELEFKRQFVHLNQRCELRVILQAAFVEVSIFSNPSSAPHQIR